MKRFNFLLKYIKPGKILNAGNLGDKGVIHNKINQRFKDSDIYGLDIIDQNKLDLNFPNQKIGSVDDMPYEDNFFDSIYLGEVLEHTWRPKLVIGECYRILKPNGLLILDTPNIYAISRMLRYFIKGKDIILGDPTHKIFFSRAVLENLLQKSNFHIIEITTDNKFTLKCKQFPLPQVGSFGFMGEHLLVAAQK